MTDDRIHMSLAPMPDPSNETKSVTDLSQTPMTRETYLRCFKMDKNIARSKPFREMYALAEELEAQLAEAQRQLSEQRQEFQRNLAELGWFPAGKGQDDE